MMRNISDISNKLKSLPYSIHNPTGTLAGIMKPPLRGESHDVWLTRTEQHKLKVNAVEDFSGQSVAEPWMLQSGEVNALEKVLQTIVTPTTKGAAKHCKHCRKSGHLAGECQSKKGQEENVQQLENQESSPRGREDGPVGSTSKRCDVQEVNKRHTHERSLHPSMPELVVEEESKGGDKEADKSETRRQVIPPNESHDGQKILS